MVVEFIEQGIVSAVLTGPDQRRETGSDCALRFLLR
jgi:hypothetical protein